MGYRDGAEDVRLFRRAIFENKVIPSESLLLRAAFSEAVTVSDPAGNAKLAKSGEGSVREAGQKMTVRRLARFLPLPKA